MLAWPGTTFFAQACRLSRLAESNVTFNSIKMYHRGKKKARAFRISYFRELFLDFYATYAKRKPAQIIIFRDGAGESHFKQLLNSELGKFVQAFRCLDESWSPKVTILASVRRHHTRFFQPKSLEDVPPGIVIDTTVWHPHNYDFYMCPHSTIRGTTRPVHYHVLLDEIGFTVDELQELILLLSYVYQRGSPAISEGSK